MSEQEFVRCPLCHDIERVEDMVGGVCLTCADAIAFSQNARRGAVIVPAALSAPEPRCQDGFVRGIGCPVCSPAPSTEPALDVERRLGELERTVRALTTAAPIIEQALADHLIRIEAMEPDEDAEPSDLRGDVEALKIYASDQDEMWIDGHNAALARVLALLSGE